MENGGPARLARRGRGALLRAAAKVGWYPPIAVRGGMGRDLRISLRQASADYSTGTNELPVQRAIVENLAPGDVFYDVGSNVGFFALIAARQVGDRGHVYAFEPVPVNARCIRANAARNRFGHLEVVESAVGAVPGTARLFVTDHPGGATLSGSDAPPDVTGAIDVAVTTIDDVVRDGRALPPSFVKIDVEGVELDVLAGMRETLERARPVLLCELDDAQVEGLKAKLAEFRAALDPHGYVIRELEPSYAGSSWNVVHLLAAPPS